MTLRSLAWLHGMGLMLLAWLGVTLSRAPVSGVEQATRVASVLTAGLCFIGLCALLARRLPLVARCLLATPLVLAAAFLLGLMVAAFVESVRPNHSFKPTPLRGAA